jgi:type II secretory pathway component PulF
MNKKTQITIASCLLCCLIFPLGAVIYLAFVFPGTIRVWAVQGKRLNAAEQFTVSLSNLSRNFGLPFLGLLTLLFIASLIWLAVAIRAKRKDSGNP